jgi:signal transduction histidine kinase/CheY-like chemotaxis protein
MSWSILTVGIRHERDTVAARQRARQIARLLGFNQLDQTRISTAVSEIARNAFNYAGGGRVEYLLEGRTAPQLFIMKVSDSGPGIAALDQILDGQYQSETGMGLGIIGARRLMDQFQIESIPGQGSTILMKILLPARSRVLTGEDVSRLTAALASEASEDTMDELRHQNQELVSALEDIRLRQHELSRLNRELEDTNRGVVALYAELDEQADHLRRADELKSKFLSNMSHEFRSPLSSILALSGLLLDGADGPLNGEQNQQINYVRRAAQDLLELVNDLLDLAKVEAGKVEVRPVEFQAANLFAALRGMLRPLLLNQSVDLVFDDAGHIPALFSDEAKVSQILRNFISNALKFTEKGEIRVSASMASEDEVLFSVADTGIGIAPENRELIFQDFSQIDHPIQRRVKGTGLGLPLSKKLATLLSGKVDVESQPGIGSTFTLRLPIHFRDAAERTIALKPGWIPDPASLPVLVVEDSPEIMMAYRNYLRGSGFEAIPASTIREAEEILDRIRPRVILLDVVLRSESTWAFLAKLKAAPETKDIPILVASVTEDQAKAYHLGADEYLLKPIERAALIGRLESLAGQPSTIRILLIDDNERDRYVLKHKLKQHSTVILDASSGAEGIRRACIEKPNLIFLDLTMPGISGFEVLNQLRLDPATQDIPVVICSSYSSTQQERQQLEQQAQLILSKEDLVHADLSQILRLAVHRAAPAAITSRENTHESTYAIDS